MNQNRSWPGVPNRYSMLVLNVIRPKSKATVVCVLVRTSPVSSTPRLNDVIGASVVSGVISEIDSTKVVLPAAKPPAITILSDRVVIPESPDEGRSESLEVIEQPFKGGEVGAACVIDRHADGKVFAHGQVTDQHTGDSEMQAQMGRYLGNG